MTRRVLLNNLLVMGILVTVCALLQDRIPPLAPVGVKLPFLPALVVYYALLRPLWLAGLAALWAGVLLDGLGSAPVGTSLAGMVGVVACCGLWVRRQMAENLASCTLITAATSIGLVFLQYGTLRWRTGFPGLDLGSLLMRGVLHGVLAVPVAVVAGWAGKTLDKLALNTDTENHADDFDWSGSGR